MSPKLWKIFGIFGIIFVAILVVFGLVLVFSIFGSSVGRKTTPPPSTYEPGIETIQSLSPFRLPEVSLESAGGFPFFSQPETPSKTTTYQTQAEVPSRMIIKTGRLNLVVKDVLDTAKKIGKFAEENGGWVVSSNISEYEKVPSGSITVRVPAEKFDEAKEYFRSLAVKVTNESVQSQDITEEYVDLQSKLRNLEATEAQLLEIMKRSGTVNEILQVYRELANVRQQIEQIKGKMQYLEQSVRMSSITVNLALSEELLPIPPSEKWKPKYVLLQSWKNVINFWKEFSYFLIKLTVWAQVWVPALIIIWFVRKVLKKRKKSNQ
jgi:predicted transcriptional regulator